MNPEAAVQLEFGKADSRRTSLILRLVEWLSGRPLFALTLASAYLAAVATLHDQMQRPAYWAQGELSHRSWNNLVTAVAVPLLVVFCIWLAAMLRRHPRPFIPLLFLGVTILLAAVSFRTLLVMNIEVIHFPQYAILAVLIFPLTGSYTATLIWTTLGGLIDECFQYFYLYADRGIHMDFNDVILNSIGGGFGLVLLCTAGVLPDHRNAARGGPWRSLTVWLCLSFILLTGAAYATGFIRLLKAPDMRPWAVVLRRGGPSTMFWTPTTWGKTYHEVHPGEWLVIAAALVGVYSLMDFLFHKPVNAQPPE